MLPPLSQYLMCLKEKFLSQSDLVTFAKNRLFQAHNAALELEREILTLKSALEAFSESSKHALMHFNISDVDASPTVSFGGFAVSAVDSRLSSSDQLTMLPPSSEEYSLSMQLSRSRPRAPFLIPFVQYAEQSGSQKHRDLIHDSILSALCALSQSSEDFLLASSLEIWRACALNLDSLFNI